jgi:hypothetical protein
MKYLYSAGSSAVSSLAASLAFSVFGGFSGVAVAFLVYSVIDVTSTVAAIVASRQTRELKRFANPKAHAVELATEVFGIALAGLLSWHVVLGVLVVPALLLVQRWSLRETVKAEKAYDDETGLWSEAAWRIQAQQKLYDARGHVAVVIIDPDESGSDQRILEVIASGLTSSDLLGRYGTRQIVVLIPVGRREAGLFLSTGFRTDLARAGVRAPLGCATTADAELEGLLIEAMSDLMARRAAAGVHHTW